MCVRRRLLKLYLSVAARKSGELAAAVNLYSVYPEISPRRKMCICLSVCPVWWVSQSVSQSVSEREREREKNKRRVDGGWMDEEEREKLRLAMKMGETMLFRCLYYSIRTYIVKL